MSNSVGSSSSDSSGDGRSRRGFRTVHLRRPGGGSFGFSFRGGREFGTGFFVSVVEFGSEAQHKGLKVGDQILRINGLSVENATHQEILQLAQHHHHLNLSLKSVGLIPVKDNINDPLTWRLVEQPQDPPLDPTKCGRLTDHSVDCFPTSCDVDRIVIDAPEGSRLGCGICKGPDWRPGIFVQYTKPNSLARQAGLQPGDQILQCNRVSFLNIDFSYAVSVLKGIGTLDLVIKKGSGIDLFPGESSGYSSASSVADDVATTPPGKRANVAHREHLDIVPTGKRNSGLPQRRGPQRDYDHDSNGNGFGSIAEDQYGGQPRRPDPPPLRHECQAAPIVTVRQECRSGGQTVVQISQSDRSGPVEVAVHREGPSLPIEKSPSCSSFSSNASLSSAISQELQRRKERRAQKEGNIEEVEEVRPPRKPVEGKNAEHDLLIAELKRRQDRRNGNLSLQMQDQNTPPSSLGDSPPPCPTPDYSDTSARQSPQPSHLTTHSSHAVKTSILRFEERNKKIQTPKSVTFGSNSTKEITPVKSNMSSHEIVEMHSIDTQELLQPKLTAPKPPPTYFQPPNRKDLSDSPKRTTVIKITEYPTENSRTPGKLEFLGKVASDETFGGELAKTLSISNLKNRSDPATVDAMHIKENTKAIERKSYNSFNGVQTPVVLQSFSQQELSNVKKTLRTFEKSSGPNTIIVQIPKRN